MFHKSTKSADGTVMQIKKALINDCLRISKVSENFAFQLFKVAIMLKFAIFLKSSLLFNSFYYLFCL